MSDSFLTTMELSFKYFSFMVLPNIPVTNIFLFLSLDNIENQFHEQL